MANDLREAPPDRQSPRTRRPFWSLCLLPAIVTGIVFSIAARRYPQVRSVAEVERLGGTVVYDFEHIKHGPHLGEDSIVWPRWLRDRVSGAWLGDVEVVSLSNTGCTDDDLKLLAGFPELYRLELNDTSITGSGFASLRELKNLEEVELSRTAVTAAGLAQLKELGTVHKLNLWWVEPTPQLVAELLKFERLMFLEWQIGWEPGRPIAGRLEAQFPELTIYSP